MYNSKDMCVDKDLTFLSFNQTVNCEFRVDELLESDLWMINNNNGLIKAVPLFNCDNIISSNPSDKVLDNNKCIILQNLPKSLIQCTSNDTGSIHFYSVELYGYCPYSILDVVDEVPVYCILHDEYLNCVGNVDVDVYIDDELTSTVTSDSNGVCRFSVDQPCTVKFVYDSLESNEIIIVSGE